MERLSKFYPDPVIFFCLILITTFGFLTLTSIHVVPSIINGFDVISLKKPMIFLIASLVGLFITSFISYILNYKVLNNSKIVYGGVIFSLLLLLLVLFKKVLTGAPVDRWLLGRSVQPSELSKIILVVFVAYYIARKGAIDNFRFFLWAIVMVAIHSFLLFLQPDKGMALFVLAVAWLMLWIGGTHYKIYMPSAGVFILVAAVGLFLTGHGYLLRRFSAWFNPIEDSFGAGYQVIQSLLAFINGGFLGQGFGKGFQKLGALTQADTDYVLATIGEEMGLPGIGFLIFLYALLVYRLFKIAREVSDTFGRLIVVGVALNLLASVSINVMMAINLLPPKGIPLPFVSYGLSNLIVNFFALGLVGSVYKRQLYYRML